MRRLVLGTRGSPLALRQSEIVLGALRAAFPDLEVETRVVRTEGDRRPDLSLAEAGGQGIFVKDIELRLVAGEIDFAVHSLKDMPAATPAGLGLAAVLPRGDVRDALVSSDGRLLSDLPAGARIGSDSRRRALQLNALRPAIAVVPIRGNVDTRVRKVESGEYEGAVLALAGLQRLGLADRAAQVFDVQELLPAVGQAALAVECRESDEELLAMLAALDDESSRISITAERAFLRELGAGCRLPVGAYASIEGAGLRLRAMLGDGRDAVHRLELAGGAADAERLGKAAAQELSRRAGVSGDG